MRIAVDGHPLLPLSRATGPTGVGRWTRQVIQAVARQAPDWSISIIGFSDEAEMIDAQSLGENVHVARVPFGARTFRRLLSARLLPALERFIEPVDAVLGPGFVAWPSRSAAELPVIHDVAFLTFPESLSPRHLQYLKLNVPRCIRRASTVITVSESVSSELQSHFHLPAERVQVVRNAAQFPEVGDEIDLPVRVPPNYVLSVGTLEPRKNLLNVLRAWESLSASDRMNHSLVIAGGAGWKTRDFDPHLVKAADRADVVLLGYVPDRFLPALYTRAAALVFPSLYEGFGLPALEAMSHGCPVITSKRGAMLEVTAGAALYVDPLDTSSIASAIAQVLKDPRLHGDLEKRGRARAADFSWDDSARALIGAVERSVTSGSSPPAPSSR